MSNQNSGSYKKRESGNQAVPFNHVVIVEDNEADEFVQETLITTLGLAKKIEKQKKTDEFMAQLQKVERLSEVPDLVMVSLNAKGGHSFLDQFSSLPEFIRAKCKLIVISSAYSKDDRINALMNPNVIRYLEKPVDVVQFRDFMYM
jgi:response regulator of citrate/malate metabolism